MVQLLRQHLARIDYVPTFPFAELLQRRAWNVPAVFGFKYSSEYAERKTQLQMGPQTSFYFYLGLLTLLRDVVEDEQLEQWGFSMREMALAWAENGTYVGQFEEQDTIYADIRAHRAAYYELLAYRFLSLNQRLDGWGDYFNGGERVEELGDYRDSWKRVRPELARFHHRTGGPGHPFVIRVFQLLTAGDSTDGSDVDSLCTEESEDADHEPLLLKPAVTGLRQRTAQR
ncbi:MAG: hypothetical protein OXT67_07400 [Zetaproteobacteria bacterium]|nr:hypothetical protein [Zetaproteobacteria bacterium]